MKREGTIKPCQQRPQGPLRGPTPYTGTQHCCPIRWRVLGYTTISLRFCHSCKEPPWPDLVSF